MTRPHPHPPSVLTIAGSDPSGAAGVQVDLQVIRDHAAHGWSVLTSIIAQNTGGVRRVWPASAEQVRAQLEAVFDDVAPDAIKIGALPTVEIVEVVARTLRERADHAPVVVDPVLASGDGASALAGGGVAEAIASELAPWVTLLTPNLPERAALALDGFDVRSGGDLVGAARSIRAALDMRGAVLLKAGHLPGATEGVIADAWASEEDAALLEGLPSVGEDVRGTGCQLASAIAARLARGEELEFALEGARYYLNEMLHERRARLGAGRAMVVRARDGDW